MEKERPKSLLTATQRYAAGALFAIALHRAQINQTLPPASPSSDEDGERRLSGGTNNSSDFASERTTQLWAHDTSGLLRPVFKFLEIDSSAWGELEEAATSSPTKHDVGSYLRLLAEENVGKPSKTSDEVALANSIDALSSNLEKTPGEHGYRKEKQIEYERVCREKLQTDETTAQSNSEEVNTNQNLQQQETNATTSIIEQSHGRSVFELNGKPLDEATLISYPRKTAVLYEILSACLASTPEDCNESTHRGKGYDARHRVALRLLATWFEVKWIKMEAIETTVACSAMALLKEEESKEGDGSQEDSLAKWKRGGIIGAAAITGGALIAITGGLAAPAIAAGFSALAPTAGTIIPIVGASGCAAVASVAGSAAGSVAVAGSFGAAGAGLTGSKMARRIGDVEEFEFKAVGENHNQGRLAIEISISGFVYEEEDFVRPWEGQHDNVERYVLQWESENLIAVSTAIRDWITSKIAKEIMKKGAMMTALRALLTAVAWPAALLSITDLIDGKWTIAVDRSDKAGKLLAEVLQQGLQGHRPVTLLGFSLGARVIFSCLQILAESESNAGIVENVVLLGAPISISDMNWGTTRKVVAGRYVNAYSTSDWILGIAFRATLLSKGLAGIQPVEVAGIENVDVTEVIESHSSYLWCTQPILDQLHLHTYCPPFNHKLVRSL